MLRKAKSKVAKGNALIELQDNAMMSSCTAHSASCIDYDIPDRTRGHQTNEGTTTAFEDVKRVLSDLTSIEMSAKGHTRVVYTTSPGSHV